MNHDQVNRVVGAAVEAVAALERIGTGLLRLAVAAENTEAATRPRDVSGLWLRPSEVEAVIKSRAKRSGYDRDVARIRLRSGVEYVVWRAESGPVGYSRYDETHEECVDRVLRALGWK